MSFIVLFLILYLNFFGFNSLINSKSNDGLSPILGKSVNITTSSVSDIIDKGFVHKNLWIY